MARTKLPAVTLKSPAAKPGNEDATWLQLPPLSANAATFTLPVSPIAPAALSDSEPAVMSPSVSAPLRWTMDRLPVMLMLPPVCENASSTETLPPPVSDPPLMLNALTDEAAARLSVPDESASCPDTAPLSAALNVALPPPDTERTPDSATGP